MVYNITTLSSQNIYPGRIMKKIKKPGEIYSRFINLLESSFETSGEVSMKYVELSKLTPISQLFSLYDQVD